MATSPRKRNKSGGTGRASKRPRRTAEDGERAIAVLHREEHASAGDSYLATRPDPSEAKVVPSLTTLALKRIVGSFGKILPRPPSESTKESELEAADAVRRLPAHLSSRLLVALLNATPCPLTTEHVTGLFLHEDTVSLAIPGSLTLPPLVLSQLSKSPYLRKLDVSGHANLRPRDIVPALKGLRQLEELLLAGCVKLDDSVVVAAAQAGEDRLKVLNLNFTGVTTKGLISVLARCKNLEVLKLGSVSGLVRRPALLGLGSALTMVCRLTAQLTGSWTRRSTPRADGAMSPCRSSAVSS